MISRRDVLVVALAVTLALAGVPILAQTQAASTSEYVIGPKDLLAIEVFQDRTLNTTDRVSQDGKITMPLLGQVQVSGLTAQAAANRIRYLLEAQYMNKADVSVVIKEFESQPISVFGAVTRPGKIPFTGELRLVEAISAVGGLTANTGQTIYVNRKGKNGMVEQLVIDADDLFVRGNPDLNIPLQANDLVNVVNDQKITIYILGEAMRPGAIEFRESQNPTLVRALAAAGGLTDRAVKSKVTIQRIVDGKSVSIQANLKKIIAGEEQDVFLQNNDTIVIKESFF